MADVTLQQRQEWRALADAATEGMADRVCRVCHVAGPHRRAASCRACEAKRQADWRKANPERSKRQHAEYLMRRIEREPDYEAKRRLAKRRRNPEHHREQFRRRLAWLSEGTVTVADLHAVYARTSGKCFYCKTSVRCRFSPKDPRGFDHVIPRVRGGLHKAENLVVCCGPCNALKAGSLDIVAERVPALLDALDARDREIAELKQALAVKWFKEQANG